MHSAYALLYIAVIRWRMMLPISFKITSFSLPVKQCWGIWVDKSHEFAENDIVNKIKWSITKPNAYFMGYTALFMWSVVPEGGIKGRDK